MASTITKITSSPSSTISAPEGNRCILWCIYRSGNLLCDWDSNCNWCILRAFFSSATLSALLFPADVFFSAEIISLFLCLFLFFHFLPRLPYIPPCWVSLLLAFLAYLSENLLDLKAEGLIELAKMVRTSLGTGLAILPFTTSSTFSCSCTDVGFCICSSFLFFTVLFLFLPVGFLSDSP